MDNSTYEKLDEKQNTEEVVKRQLHEELLKLQSEVEKTTQQNNIENDLTQETKQQKSDSSVIDKIIQDANQYFLVKILSPEITKNEDKKREHKDILIEIVKNFLNFQFKALKWIVGGTIFMIFAFHALKNDLELEYIEVIIKFICAYITSVVVEVIAMLKFIVENVFDTSITGLVEFYKDKTEEKQEENKK